MTANDGSITFGPLSLDGAYFDCNVELSGAVFRALATFERANFNGDALFDRAEFNGQSNFAGSHFNEGLSLKGAQFVDDCTLSRVDIKGGMSAEQIHTKAAFWLEDATITGPANFRDAVIEGVAYINKTKVTSKTDFTSTIFKSEASFESIDISGSAIFTKAKFEALAWFVKATFHKEASFEEVTFDRDCRFTDAVFSGGATFRSSSFNGSIWFNNASAPEAVHFDNAHIASQLILDNSHFGSDLTLVGTQLDAAEEMGPVTIEEMFVLDSSTFTNPISLHVQAARFSAIAVRFMQGANLNLTNAGFLLDRTIFGDSSSITGRPAVRATDAAARPLLLSLHGVDTTNLTLADVNLTACLFGGAYNLDKIRLEGSRLFANTPGSIRVQVAKLTIPIWPPMTRRQALAEEHYWRLRTSQRRKLFKWLIHPEWYPPECRTPQWALMRSVRPRNSLEPENLAGLYRALRKAQEDSKNEPGATDFYYGEMEMRRHSHSASFGERLILILYWILSGYGLRASRALFMLIILILVSGVLFHALAPPAAGATSLLAGVASVLESALALSTPVVKLPVSIRLLRIVVRVAGPVLLGLAFLAIRNRIKR